MPQPGTPSLVVDARARFTATADAYARWRPTYPDALIDWIAATAELPAGASVVDVGCGTGIATRLFHARGYDVVGIDPNEAMLAEAAPGPRYQVGEAAATGLASASVDLVTVAHAFHWFDVPRALAELRRILRPTGWAAAFWNLRAPTPFMRAYEGLLATIGEYRATPRSADAIAALDQSPGLTARQSWRGELTQPLDREGLSGRARSSSYVAHGVQAMDVFERALDRLFAEHARDGHVVFSYETVARMWRFA